MTTKVNTKKEEESNEIAPTSADEIAIGSPEEIAPLGAVVGDFGTEDMTFPKFQFAQGVGPLSDRYPKGAVVLEGECQIAEMGGDPLEITVMRMEKSYEENVPYGGDEMPRLASTKDEVYAMGGTLAATKDENGQRIPATWKPVATTFICIKMPEPPAKPKDEKDEESMLAYKTALSNHSKLTQWFPYGHMDEDGEETFYAFAEWKIRGVAYYRAADYINTAARTYLRSGLLFGSFNLFSDKAVFNGNTVAVPKIVRGTPNHRDLVNWLAEFI